MVWIKISHFVDSTIHHDLLPMQTLWLCNKITQLPPLRWTDNSHNSLGVRGRCHLNIDKCCFWPFSETTDAPIFLERTASKCPRLIIFCSKSVPLSGWTELNTKYTIQYTYLKSQCSKEAASLSPACSNTHTAQSIYTWAIPVWEILGMDDNFRAYWTKKVFPSKLKIFSKQARHPGTQALDFH